ncbi:MULTISPECIES: exosporium protein ExsC [Bacillus cereus group]|uniref:exosporium protein ExsC n=1 Tax=Bacillus cereus group TaxID=86661 RepID=UPI0007B6F1A5|nr:exosporium protein ExsC [Bacillus cereus]ANC08357.1 exosporium protein C [Bacillus cereus]ANC14177.1 exosporium protein C [Bacillus cereus]MDA1992460.1 exosporium protein C [Bacillus cereus]MDA1997998.1 exosporium protein C [Bacillus cereus]MDA3652489.1 exosporium protein C [Bacillus cereus]
MSKHIIDYQATQPLSKTGETTFAIPSSPNKAILANLKLRIPSRDSRNNRVELIATIGVDGITGTSQVLFRIFRDNIEIFNTQVGFESTDSEQFYVQTFQAIDQNVGSVTHEYSLTAENLTSGASAEVVGPLSFSALAIGQERKCY